MKYWKLITTATALVLSTSANAAYVYSYTGNNYSNVHSANDPTGGNIYDSSMHLEMSFTTDNLITDFAGDAYALVTNYSVFDGVHLLTDENSYQRAFNLNTDSAGNILQWQIYVSSSNIENRSVNINGESYTGDIRDEDLTRSYECVAGPFGDCVNATYWAYEFDNSGTWSVSAVPVPAAAWLFGSGLLGLIGFSKRKAS